MANDKLSEKVSFRISKKDRAIIDRVSSGLGFTLSEFIRDFTIRITEQIENTNNHGK